MDKDLEFIKALQTIRQATAPITDMISFVSNPQMKIMAKQVYEQGREEEREKAVVLIQDMVLVLRAYRHGSCGNFSIDANRGTIADDIIKRAEQFEEGKG